MHRAIHAGGQGRDGRQGLRRGGRLPRAMRDVHGEDTTGRQDEDEGRREEDKKGRTKR